MPPRSTDLPGAEPEELFVRFRVHRDERALSALYDAFAPRQFATGVKFFRSRHADDAARAMAGDAVQETWLQIWLKRDQWDPSRGSFASWIYAIHYRCLLHQAHAAPSGGERLFLDLISEPAAPNIDPDRRLMAREALETLSETLSPDSEALLMAYCLVANPDTDLIAASLGISNAALRKRIGRIREAARRNPKLQNLLEALGIGGSGSEEPEE